MSAISFIPPQLHDRLHRRLRAIVRAQNRITERNIRLGFDRKSHERFLRLCDYWDATWSAYRLLETY